MHIHIRRYETLLSKKDLALLSIRHSRNLRMYRKNTTLMAPFGYNHSLTTTTRVLTNSSTLRGKGRKSLCSSVMYTFLIGLVLGWNRIRCRVWSGRIWKVILGSGTDHPGSTRLQRRALGSYSSVHSQSTTTVYTTGYFYKKKIRLCRNSQPKSQDTLPF